MVLGGAGLVGTAVARRLALLKPAWRPARIIVASRLEPEAKEAVSRLQADHQEHSSASVDFIPEWGDVFVRTEFAEHAREHLLRDADKRQALLADLYDDLTTAYEKSHLVYIMRKHSPQVLIDSVNTATGLSYQNVFDAAQRVRQALVQQQPGVLAEEAERMLQSQSVPHLVRHIQILSRVAEEQNLETYLKVGTTGTGGMGLNIPYTHSESRPSSLILAKNEAAFGHSGLLYLWSQTPGAPTVHEVKPGAAIGYRNIGVHAVSDRYGNVYIRKPRLVPLTNSTNDKQHGSSVLDVREDEGAYHKLDKMTTLAVDMGENGLFSAEEFRTLSAPGSMELISPEEIAEVCVQELLGIGTGNNVLAAVRAGVLRPGYRAGTIRSFAVQLLAELEKHQDADPARRITMPSIAIGKLGPPFLSKILFEAHILKVLFGGEVGLKELAECDPSDLSRKLCAEIQSVVNQDGEHSTDSLGFKITLSAIAHVAPTIGVPILLEGNLMLRGPNITVPEPVGRDSRFNLTTLEAINKYAEKGWVDLRPLNLQVWKERARHILSEPIASSTDTTQLMGLHYAGSGKHQEIDATALATWILAGEMKGFRDLDSVHCRLDENL